MKAFLLTLSVLLAFTRETNAKPRVVLLPRYPSVYVGDDVSLQCKNGTNTIIWKLNGEKLSHEGSPLVLTMVTPADNGQYKCQGNNEESDAYNLNVLNLEPYAQLSLSPGGAVVSRGDARVLKLQVYDGEVQKWKCYVFRDNSGFVLQVLLDGENVGRVYADLENSQRATFWCKKTNSTHRSNVVTLMMTDQMVRLEPATPVLQEQALTLRCAAWGGGKVVRADFYKDNKNIKTTESDTYTISNPTKNDNGQYKCSATYRYSHISKEAATKTAESDPQQIKVIEGPPAAFLDDMNRPKLICSCKECKNCEGYQWHHIDSKTRIDQTSESISINDKGSYTCRAICDHGFSRFSNVYNHAGEPGGGGLIVVLLVVIVILLGLICVVIAVITRRRNRNSMQTTGQNKGDGKDKSGGDYEQIGLRDKEVYHTLGEGADPEKAEGGYEALKKKDEDKAVYHTLGKGEDPEKAEGGYEALKKADEDKAVYHTLGAGEGSGQAKDQGGYEALQSVKAQVYQTLSSGSGKPEGESEGGYEQLPQKPGDDKAEENPYEELKAEKQKKEATQEKE